ncbi:DUF1127 domain-containing protein [Polaromonas sp. SM01]|uniref:DUF1127 domain-containing protein n=1 Tax=Polaromonas sp. SM01 TaxID=3085630 RepID=UPI0029818DAC|nr:DUF1127 domain-containing protein [Polaromonas sp. SM01]MDW5443269.1 DUF1127 domain-containing protein [Polaromonas sp. SM01]
MLLKAWSIFFGALPNRLAGRLGLPLLVPLRRWARQHRQRKQDLALLRQMSTCELKDLGLGRGDIPALLDAPASWRQDRR